MRDVSLTVFVGGQMIIIPPLPRLNIKNKLLAKLMEVNVRGWAEK